MSVADNLKRVRDRIARAAEKAGRQASDITLVGVTKYVGPQEAAELVAAGCQDLGESRPQELWKKCEALHIARAGASPPPASYSPPPAAHSPPPAPSPEPPLIHWHLIGHLQRNKVTRTLPLVSLIHSVDSERLLAAINEANKLPLPLGEGRGAVVNAPPIPVLLEVNTSGEAAKHGLAPDAVEPILAAAENYPHVQIRGLMTMAALDGDDTVAAGCFATLRELRDRLKTNTPPYVQLHELSMGMSGDFEIAIQEGATIVRVGTALWEDNS